MKIPLHTAPACCLLACACTDSNSPVTSRQLPEEMGFAEPCTVSQAPITVPLSPDITLEELAEKMQTHSGYLEALFAESASLEEEIKKQLEGLRYA